MKEKMLIRLNELNTELLKLTDFNKEHKETGLTRSERISVCKYKIEELEKLLKDEK